MDGCSEPISQAINTNITKHHIVHLDYNEGAAAELLAESDGTAESVETVEFWGKIEGKEWRVHLDREIEIES